MKAKIYNYLKKYYIHNPNKFKKLLDCKTEDDIVITFNKLWGKEHGGLFRIDEPFNPPEILPHMKNNRIIITDTGSNSEKFHKKYITKLNKLLLSAKELNLDFQNNYGGKPQVMIAGLLPLFKNNGVLSYYYNKNKKRHNDIIMKNNNIIISKSNNNAFSVGTNKKVQNIKEINIYFNEYTISSAEQAIICLLSLSNSIKINLIGIKSGGYTTVNKYIKLNDKYGLEIPIGYMGTKDKIIKTIHT